MHVPENCTVLVIGGGPAGSYAATVLAREGVDVVCLEADKHPRYHIGESMLPTTRFYLKFIGLFDQWDAQGWRHKYGAAFKFNWSVPGHYTDFISAGGDGAYAWNVVRSEADELLFKYAGECGAKVFDTTRVEEIQFESHIGLDSNINRSNNTGDTNDTAHTNGTSEPKPSGTSTMGRPVSATWSSKDGTSGKIQFKYLIDASGRRGIVSTKYLKNRTFNKGLKNIANWGYWKGGGEFGRGTKIEGCPYFEALSDGSGWCWLIPLHNGTHSVGVVQNQERSEGRKKEMGSPSREDFYRNSIDLAPNIKDLLSEAELVSEVRSASDWSYSASTYAGPNWRLAGDAGCFIDPFFSSGMHLAFTGGLAAAATLCAVIRGEFDENTAAEMHSSRVNESYARFLLIVVGAMKQIRLQEQPVLYEAGEEGYGPAMELFKPIIQGLIDAGPNRELTMAELTKAVEASGNVPLEHKELLIEKLHNIVGREIKGSVKLMADAEAKSKEPLGAAKAWLAAHPGPKSAEQERKDEDTRAMQESIERIQGSLAATSIAAASPVTK